MSQTWLTDMTHFIDEDGELISEPYHAKRLGEYIASIVLMVSYPTAEIPPEYRVVCRRRPKQQSCGEEIAGFVDPDTEKIVWVCPRCGDRGFISNWRGTVWDLSEVVDIDH
ncbi:hypothetical protein LPW11_02970 [Geomonas sp. RF6]|uniref:hypothetical protein n=1 Tax=Geomonas sp. RF6 TaxID=2897342 RepID=UPI001E3EE77F|nr:hypothetical protein [Geomonas sp. RF6]UFS71162.1 hypothetical protein LPW11_02970 [Geomonas sp. RF6]